MVGVAVYRMGREQLLPLEENPISRAILAVFRPLFRWTLNHKTTFLTIPVSLTLLGALVWLGFDRLAYPLEAGLKALGADPTETAGWTKLRQTFPGIGREFMPPLDEGSLLFMPSLLPAASLTQAQEVIARQDLAIQSVPEVASVVGKLGRAESALDPASIGTVETIILLKPENEWRWVRRDAADGHPERGRHGGAVDRLPAGAVPVLPGEGVAAQAPVGLTTSRGYCAVSWCAGGRSLVGVGSGPPVTRSSMARRRK